MKAILFPSTLLLTLAVPAGGSDVHHAVEPAGMLAVSQALAGRLVTEAKPAQSSKDKMAQDDLPLALTCGLAGFRDRLMDRVNQARAASRMCGRVLYPATALVNWDPRLFNVAARHSVDMSSHDYFSHTGSDGGTVANRLADAGYLWGTYGENIAAGQTSIDQVMRDLLNSPGHCAIVMKQTVTEVGVACVANHMSAYKMYWSMTFARPAQALGVAN